MNISVSYNGTTAYADVLPTEPGESERFRHPAVRRDVVHGLCRTLTALGCTNVRITMDRVDIYSGDPSWLNANL